MLDINSAAMPTGVAEELHAALVREDGQEDLTFGLWYPSTGRHRRTALLARRVSPAPGDRQIHGNVSFNASYLHRALQEAVQAGAGLGFLHSHPFPGWHHMSEDDIAAETRISRAACALTDLPLLGLTTGNDGTWSARTWVATPDYPVPRMTWLADVRVVGAALRVSRPPTSARPSRRNEALIRTVSAWGDNAQADLERLRVGIVGLGSVGSMVAESLARMGLQKMTFIDFDRVELKNLDRLVTATEADIGRFKTDVAVERVSAVATAPKLDLRTVVEKISHPEAYGAALDCDVLFSCVDRPHPRHVLNFLAYSHLVPVIDGGIRVRHRNGRFRGADWQVQTVAPGRACLRCLGAYDENIVALDQAGLLDDPSYMAGVDPASVLHRRENVFPFSANLASLEVFHLISMATGIAGQSDLGVQRFRYYPGIMDQRFDVTCKNGCEFGQLVASGDHHFSLMRGPQPVVDQNVVRRSS
jgi:molybdopterin/thiamine biosynthesis adenylyltransferase